MAAGTRRLVVEFVGDTKDLEKGLGSVKRELGGVDKAADSVAGTSKSTSKGLSTLKTTAIGAGAAFGVAGLAGGISSAIDAFRESQAIGNQTKAVIKATGGAAGVSAGQVGDLATALSKKTGIDDEAIQKGSNLILTFKNIRNEAGAGRDIFNQTTKAALDLSKAGFGSIESASKMLGKALNDPVKGISALSRSGVTFSQKQKDVIAKLVGTGKASDRLKAQQVILKEVNSQVGGSAVAQATATDKLRVTLGNLQENIGALLVPTLNAAADALDGLFSYFSQHKTQAIALGVAVGVVATTLTAVAVASKVATVATTLWGAATKITTGAQWLLNAALAANPFGLVVVAIAALVAGLVIAYTKIDWFRQGVDTAFNAVKTAFNWVKDNWPLILAILTGPIGLAVLAFSKFGDDIINAISGAITSAGKALAGAATWIFDTLKAGVASYLNAYVGIGSWIVNRLAEGLTVVTSAFGAVWGWIRNRVDEGVKALATSFVGIGSWILNRLAAGLTTLTTALSGVGGWLRNRVSDAVTAIPDSFVSIGAWVVNRLAQGLTTVTDALSGVGGWLKNRLVDSFTAVKDGFTGVGGSIVGWIVDGLKGGLKKVGEFLNSVRDVVNKLPGVNITVDFTAGLAEGGTFGGTKALARGGAFRKTGGLINSPITLMGEEAPRWPEFVIPSNPAYRKRAVGLVAQAADAVGLAAGGTFGAGGGPVATASSVLGSVGNALKSVVSGAWSSVMDLVPGLPEIPAMPAWAGGFTKAILEQFVPWLKKNAGPIPKMKAYAESMVAKNLPYVYGGGHSSWGPPFDCSGFVSAILHAGDLINSPTDTTGLRNWGKPGDGPVTVGVWGTSGPNAHTMIKLGDDFYESGGSGGPRGGRGAHWLPGWSMGFPDHRVPAKMAQGGAWWGAPGAISKLSTDLFPPDKFGWGLKNGGVYGPYVGTFHNGGIAPSDGLANVQAGETIIPVDGASITIYSTGPTLQDIVRAEIRVNDRGQSQFARAGVSR